MADAFAPASDPSAPPPAAPPSGPPDRGAGFLPTTPHDPWYAPYRDPNHPQHDAAVAEVQRRFQQASGAVELWRDDQLERPSPAEPRAPWALVSPNPHTPLPPPTLTAVANALAPIAGGRKDLVQAALDFLEGGPADRLPEPPHDYQPPDPTTTLAELRRGWGAKAEENLRLAQAVVRVYDAQHGGKVSEYLARTKLGDDVQVIRLAARTAREWIKQGWRP